MVPQREIAPSLPQGAKNAVGCVRCSRVDGRTVCFGQGCNRVEIGSRYGNGTALKGAAYDVPAVDATRVAACRQLLTVYHTRIGLSRRRFSFRRSARADRKKAHGFWSIRRSRCASRTCFSPPCLSIHATGDFVRWAKRGPPILATWAIKILQPADAPSPRAWYTAYNNTREAAQCRQIRTITNRTAVRAA